MTAENVLYINLVTISSHSFVYVLFVDGEPCAWGKTNVKFGMELAGNAC